MLFMLELGDNIKDDILPSGSVIGLSSGEDGGNCLGCSTANSSGIEFSNSILLLALRFIMIIL